MHEDLSPPDLNLARVAAKQHGVVTSRQLESAGISKDAALHRMRAGRLHRIHRAVYAVGHRSLSDEGRWIAAVLACGEGAALSHRPAVALLRLLPATAGPIDVTIPHSRRAGERNGIRVHRSRSLTPNVTTRRKGIPVTTPARTIADLRRIVPAGLLRRAIREAQAIGLDIGEDVEADHTESELEHRFLRLCRRHRLPMPETNAEVGGFRVDFLWRERAVVVETDGYRYHRGRQAFEDDRTRDTQLRLMGYEVVRFTYRQVTEESRRVAAALRALLGTSRRSAARPP